MKADYENRLITMTFEEFDQLKNISKITINRKPDSMNNGAIWVGYMAKPFTINFMVWGERVKWQPAGYPKQTTGGLSYLMTWLEEKRHKSIMAFEKSQGWGTRQ